MENNIQSTERNSFSELSSEQRYHISLHEEVEKILSETVFSTKQLELILTVIKNVRSFVNVIEIFKNKL